MFRHFSILVLILALLISGCGLRVQAPVEGRVGEDVREAIKIAVPETQEPLSLTFKFGAGDLKLSPASGPDLVSGSVIYNIPDLKPEIEVEDATVTMQTGKYNLNGIPNLDKMKNEWDLQIGPYPLALSIEAGAYDGDYEFGGLALTSLTVKDGASDVKLKFSSPNKAAMDILRYDTGASKVSMEGLANANFRAMIFNSGAGNYTLDFSGELKHDATVTIDSGVSNVTLIIPDGIAAQVSVEGGLLNVSAPGWEKNGGVYCRKGAGPLLTIIVDMGAGNLVLTR
jgi:hypothetical protein